MCKPSWTSNAPNVLMQRVKELESENERLREALREIARYPEVSGEASRAQIARKALGDEDE